MSCPYAYVLGVPGQGVHTARLGPVAMFDTVGTILLAVLTAWLTKTSVLWNFVAWFVAGEVLHYWFGTQTAFLRVVGLTPKCS